ncbi:low-density lipoprotein receptor-related protein 1-like [Anneissia japonica]|uniref:low-density lipoprotein receptor-related protein 1-like n=1 Tax=Anneissia japonica TaxID=1529436 RepID=UPI0014256544|nr:low-density lipoprotein receptor-related protein 1-like [Anneissia japonica]
MTLIYNSSYTKSTHYWTSVAADYHTGNVTFHDKVNRWIYLSEDFGTPGGGFAFPIEGGTSGRVEAMAIDWLAQNVYWVDEGYNWIKMTNYLGEGESLIVDLGLERPSGIACHPIEGYLFWTELGNKYPAKIERSSLSGGNRVTIVTLVSEPTAIAVDTITNRIYWTDHNATNSKIESSDVNGEDRRMEVSQPLSDGKFKSISVDEDYIFVSVFVGTEYSIRYYNKSTPSELVFEYSFDNSLFVNDVCVTGPNIQQKPVTLPCDGHTCGHFCVSAADGKHECICRDNYVLNPNGTCSIDLSLYHPPYCVIGRMNGVSRFHPTLLHYGLDDKQQYISDILGKYYGNVTAVAVDIRSHILFYASDTHKNMYVIRLESGQYPIVIESSIGRVDGKYYFVYSN